MCIRDSHIPAGHNGSIPPGLGTQQHPMGYPNMGMPMPPPHPYNGNMVTVNQPPMMMQPPHVQHGHPNAHSNVKVDEKGSDALKQFVKDHSSDKELKSEKSKSSKAIKIKQRTTNAAPV